MFTSLFLTIGLIHLIALASPGPDFALILRTSLHRPTALGAALGIALAIVVHATLSLTGISLLIAEHPWLFMTVKVIGALYLGWLGWGLSRRPGAARRARPARRRRGAGLAQGGAARHCHQPAQPQGTAVLHGAAGRHGDTQVDGLTRGLLVLELFLLSLVWFGVLAWSLSTVRAQRLLVRAASAQSGHRPAVWRGQPLHPDRHGRRGLRPGPALIPVLPL